MHPKDKDPLALPYLTEENQSALITDNRGVDSQSQVEDTPIDRQHTKPVSKDGIHLIVTQRIRSGEHDN